MADRFAVQDFIRTSASGTWPKGYTKFMWMEWAWQSVITSMCTARRYMNNISPGRLLAEVSSGQQNLRQGSRPRVGPNVRIGQVEAQLAGGWRVSFASPLQMDVVQDKYFSTATRVVLAGCVNGDSRSPSPSTLPPERRFSSCITRTATTRAAKLVGMQAR
ncbi:hypothetical protein C8Q74DRAFT_1437137 [Fomes fomentarius]|nr:hypothetical protein C8Q74DRAFT_1437137 [Fomes fomentarius]